MRLIHRQRFAPALLAVMLLAPLAHSFSPPAAAQQSQPQGQSPSAAAPAAPDVQVTKETKTTTWYANPTWIVIGLVVLGLVIVLVMAGRSRTTVIKQ